MKITSMEMDSVNVFAKTSFIEQTQQTPPSFSQWVLEKVDDTNTKLQQADDSLQKLASGQGESLHHTMLALEEARISFQLLEQIRTRLMQSWQELSREQI